jgi:hypothetical protein
MDTTIKILNSRPTTILLLAALPRRSNPEHDISLHKRPLRREPARVNRSAYL